jgi:hypothetical protein
MPWSRVFEDPIPLPRGRQLVTLKDAAAYIMKLPKAEQDLEEWQAASHRTAAKPRRKGALAEVDMAAFTGQNRNCSDRAGEARSNTSDLVL